MSAAGGKKKEKVLYHMFHPHTPRYTDPLPQNKDSRCKSNGFDKLYAQNINHFIIFCHSFCAAKSNKGSLEHQAQMVLHKTFMVHEHCSQTFVRTMHDKLYRVITVLLHTAASLEQ